MYVCSFGFANTYVIICIYVACSDSFKIQMSKLPRGTESPGDLPAIKQSAGGWWSAKCHAISLWTVKEHMCVFLYLIIQYMVGSAIYMCIQLYIYIYIIVYIYIHMCIYYINLCTQRIANEVLYYRWSSGNYPKADLLLGGLAFSIKCHF